MKKILFAISFVLFLIPMVYAHCPLCTAAVGTGIVVTRFYGVDDAIVGIWIGAFIVSTALWLNKAIKKKFIPLQELLLIILALASTIIPLYLAGLIGNMPSKLFGVDKLLLGILAGSLATYLGFFVSNIIKKKREKVLFPFQTIILTLAFLLLSSAIFWLIVSFVK